MHRVALSLAALFGLLFVVVPDAALNYGQSVAIMLTAALSTAFILSMAGGPQPEAAMAHDGEDSIKLKGFGGEGEIRGPGLFERIGLGSSKLTNTLLATLIALLLWHDNSTTAVQKRQAQAVEVANFLNAQPEETRLAWGKRMQVPESLRQQQMTP